MDSIDLKKIIEKTGADTAEVAGLLFPGNGYPMKALQRIFRGEGELTASQISRLAHHFDVPIDRLFTLEQWKGSVERGVLVLSQDDYVAKLFIHEGRTQVWHKGELFHETLLHSKSITLSEYIEDLNNLIN